MTDKVQAKKDLEFCSAELSKYQNLSRSGLTRDEMLAIDGIMIKLKERIKNLREALYVWRYNQNDAWRQDIAHLMREILDIC